MREAWGRVHACHHWNCLALSLLLLLFASSRFLGKVCFMVGYLVHSSCGLWISFVGFCGAGGAFTFVWPAGESECAALRGRGFKRRDFQKDHGYVPYFFCFSV